MVSYISCAKGKTCLSCPQSFTHTVFRLDHLPADPVSKRQPDPTPPAEPGTKQVSMSLNVCTSSYMLHACLLLKLWFRSTSVPEMLNLAGFLSSLSQDSRPLPWQQVIPPLLHQQSFTFVLLFLHQGIGGRARPTLGLQTPVRLLLQETRKSFSSRNSLEHDSVPFVCPDFKHGRQLPVKPPPRRPAVDSISALSGTPANRGNPPGSIKNIAIQAAYGSTRGLGPHADSMQTVILQQE